MAKRASVLRRRKSRCRLESSVSIQDNTDMELTDVNTERDDARSGENLKTFRGGIFSLVIVKLIMSKNFHFFLIVTRIPHKVV